MLGFFTTSIGVQEVTNATGLTALHQLGLGAGVAGLAAVVVLQPWFILRLVNGSWTRPALAESASS
jgi:hypothetical protein